MITEPSHFQGSFEKDIHIFSELSDTELIEATLERVAQALGYRFAVLRGERMTTEDEALDELETALALPSHGDPDYELNWNGASDYVSSMRQRPPYSNSNGHLVLYRNPAHFISADTVSFVFLFDILGTHFEQNDVDIKIIPFHIAIGPIDHRNQCFINSLSISRHFCHECSMHDD